MGAGQGGWNCFSAGKLVRRKMEMTQFLLFDLSGKWANSIKVENLMETSKLLQVSYLFVPFETMESTAQIVWFKFQIHPGCQYKWIMNAVPVAGWECSRAAKGIFDIQGMRDVCCRQIGNLLFRVGRASCLCHKIEGLNWYSQCEVDLYYKVIAFGCYSLELL